MNRRVLDIKQNTDKSVSFSYKASAKDEEDGIGDVLNGESTRMRNGDGEAYDLSGRRVSAASRLSKGVYIIGGRRRVVR
jgi:hypothetical protein